MKQLILFLFCSILLVSCYKNEPKYLYPYEKEPHYSFGYAEYFGDWYADYENPNNVISLSLFSDSLKITTDNELAGIGQYLYIEDIFVPNEVNYLAEGTYYASESEGEYTFLPGKKFKVDDYSVNTGAYVLFLEKNNNFSIQKFISHGKFTVAITDVVHTINFDFVLSDSTTIKGSFNDTLPHFDSSKSDMEAVRNPIKFKLK